MAKKGSRTSERVIVNCFACGKEIDLYLYAYKKSKNKIFFCDRICYNLGHVVWNKGREFSEETKKKQSDAAKKRMENPNEREKLSIAAKGRIPWNKDRKCPEISNAKKGKHPSEKTRERMSIAQQNREMSGEGNPFYGKHHSEEAIEKNRQAHLGKKFTKEQKAERRAEMAEKGTNVAWNKGLKDCYSEETLIKMSENRKGKVAYYPTDEIKQKISASVTEVWKNPEHRERVSKALMGHPGLKGEDNPAWNGGSSFFPYGLEFNEKLKEHIRGKFGRVCFECGKAEDSLDASLHIHHRDYDKQNNTEENLLPLCNQCHSRTNWNREYWQDHFVNKLAIYNSLTNFDDFHQSYFI